MSTTTTTMSATSTYFQTLPTDNTEHIVRHVSPHPRHPLWKQTFREDNFHNLIEAGGALQHAVRSQFTGISTIHARLENGETVREKDKYSYQTVRFDFKRLAKSAVHLNILSLILTPRETRLILKQKTFFPRCTERVEDLKLLNFHDSDKDVISSVLRYIGKNLTSFSSNITCYEILKGIHNICSTKLSILEFGRIGNDTRSYLCLSSVGDWASLCKNVTQLSLNYCKPCTTADVKLVRQSFTNLTYFSVTYATPKPTVCYELIVRFFGYIARDRLKLVNVGDLPALLLVELRKLYPCTKFIIRLRANEMLAQLAAGGEAIRGISDFRRRPGFERLQDGPIVSSAVKDCTGLEQVHVLYPLRVPLGNVVKLVISSQCEKYLRYVADATTGVLRHLVIKGKKAEREVLQRIAKKNRRLECVHLSLAPVVDECGVVNGLEAFLCCEQMELLSFANELIMPVFPMLSITPVLAETLAKYRMRKTEIRIGQLVHNKR